VPVGLLRLRPLVFTLELFGFVKTNAHVDFSPVSEYFTSALTYLSTADPSSLPVLSSQTEAPSSPPSIGRS
jgi:hypothetical protein